jgi:hypothetical protein
MGLFSKKESKNIIAVLDIGSGNIGGAIVQRDGAKPPKILYTTQKDIIFQDEFKFERFLSSMLETADIVLAQLQKNSPQKIKETIVVLSAPWYLSQTRTINQKSDKVGIVTRRKVDSLILAEVEELKKNFDIRYKSLTGSKAELVDVKNIRMKLNGYETKDPFGKYANQFEAFIFVSLSPNTILNSLRDKIKKHFPKSTVSFHSFSFAAYCVLRDIYTNNRNFMFVDISGEMTDISVVYQEALVESLSFSLGENFLLRTLSSCFNTVSDEALTNLKLYIENKSAEGVNKKMVGFMAHAEKEWVDAFKKNLAALSHYTVVPSKIFVITDAPFYEWFTSIMKKTDYAGISFAGQSMDVEVLNPAVLGKFVEFDLNVSRDIFIIIDALFAKQKYLADEKNN